MRSRRPDWSGWTRRYLFEDGPAAGEHAVPPDSNGHAPRYAEVIQECAVPADLDDISAISPEPPRHIYQRHGVSTFTYRFVQTTATHDGAS